jgi:hypothetical protein
MELFKTWVRKKPAEAGSERPGVEGSISRRFPDSERAF